MSLNAIFDPMVRSYFDDDEDNGGGSSNYTGLPCYAIHQWTEETEEFLGEPITMVKISDDVPYVVSGQKCITFDVGTGNPTQDEFIVNESSPDGVNTIRAVFVGDGNSGLIVLCIVDETLSAMSGTSTGIWMLKNFVPISTDGRYMIIV